MDSIFKVIDNEQDNMVSLLKKWASINSGSNNIAGLQKMAEAIKQEASRLNANLKEVAISGRSKMDSHGKIIQIPNGKALTLKKNPKAKTQVLLAGHYDTVYDEHHPFQNVEVVNTILTGPGVADMKGGLIVMLKSLEILESSLYAGKLGFEVIINPDEEVGSSSSYPLYVEAAIGKKAGLVFEPSFADGAFVSARKGSFNLSIATFGKSAHAGRDFEKGESSIAALSHFIHKAHELNDLKNGITINFGHIQGGGPVNIVPDLCIAQINIRYLEAPDLKRTLTIFSEIIKGIEKEGIKMVLHELSSRGPKPLEEKTKNLFDILKKVGLQLNQKIELRESGGVSDGNILASVGLPTIDTLGVIGGNIHTNDEYMLLDSLKERVKLTVALLIELIKTDEKNE